MLALVLLALAGPAAAKSEYLVDDFARFNELVCSVIHNARPQFTVPPASCAGLAFMWDPTLKTAVEEEKVLFSYGQVIRGCGEFARSHDVATGQPRERPCSSGNDVCVAMERQARSSGTLALGHLFHRAAWVWKSGTDTYSGSSHNCHAYGLDGAATYALYARCGIPTATSVPPASPSRASVASAVPAGNCRSGCRSPRSARRPRGRQKTPSPPPVRKITAL